MLKQLRPLAAVLALSGLAPLAAHAGAVTLNFNDAITHAAGAGIDLTSQYFAKYGITFSLLNSNGFVQAYNADSGATSDPLDLASCGASDRKACGFVGGADYRLTFDMTRFNFDVLTLSVVGGGPAGGTTRKLTAFDSNGVSVGGQDLQNPPNGVWTWQNVPVADGGAGGFAAGNIASLDVSTNRAPGATVYIDNLSFDCFDTSVCDANKLPGTGTLPPSAPEPVSLALVAVALVGAGAAGRRRTR